MPFCKLIYQMTPVQKAFDIFFRYLHMCRYPKRYFVCHKFSK